MERSIGDAVTGGQRGGGLPLASGAALGQYRVVRLLGRGGMGEVYEVEHSVLHRRYALKLLPAEVSNSAGARQRFEREAEVMANLDHPNIVRVDDFGESESRCWLRMDLANGVAVSGKQAVSLHDLAAAYGGRIEQRLLAGILEQVLAGLSHAHARGVVHRDLKPSNILIWTDGAGSAFKIADFGLARLVGEDWLRSRAELTVRASMSLGGQPTAVGEAEGSSTRSLLGTYEYMSPEQKRGEEADARSDIYAVGLMAYRLLTGRGLGMKRPSEIVKALDPRWDAMVLSVVEEEREERTTGCAELMEAVRALAEDSLPEERASVRKVAGVSAPGYSGPVVARGGDAGGAKITERKSPEGHKAEDPMSIDLGGGVKLDLVWIPPGEFMMGSPPDELGRSYDEIQHPVTITKGFWMGKFPVTQGQWVSVMGANPSYFQRKVKTGWLSSRKELLAEHPVERVSWNDAVEFCRKLTPTLPDPTRTGKVRLPTEAEWEYACRAGTTTALNNGKPLTSKEGRCANLDEVAWYGRNSGDETHRVGEKRANVWGLYDMLGNVWEWCGDGYGEYPNGAVTGPTGGSSGSSRVYRGGGWISFAGSSRSACRRSYDPGDRYNYLGFRVVVGR